ncbi:MAG: HAMP domain-containing histidine kinase [Oscillospiraceae bacterium]|nr:HAMP domain-containing histidine kinase [Oscillospiraceae bacterium]
MLAVLLGLICLLLGLRIYTVERALRGAARQLKEGGKIARLRMETPNRSAEILIAAVNTLLEDQAKEETQHHNRERDLRRQIANVSHDLRTPLTSILGYLQLLEDDDLFQEERQNYLGVVKSRAKALQSLITSFYDLSRLESGEFPLIREPVDLEKVLSGLLAAFYDDLTHAGFEVQVELAPALPPIYGDSNAVLRIFTNLIRNTLDHGSGLLEIRLFQEDGHVVSSFANDAGGMTDAEIVHVFDRFFTTDKVRTGRNTGLGLAIVKALADQMGCRAEALLEEGRFLIRIVWS